MLKRMIFHFGILILVFSIWQQQIIAEDYFDLCRLVKNGTLMRKPGTCSEYIECLGSGNDTLHSCEDSNVFDPNKKSCVEATNDNTIYCGNRCEELDGKWVSDPTNCRNYFYCKEGESLSGRCEEGQHFDEDTQACVYGSNSACVGVPNICEILADSTKLRNENNCMQYYQCSNGKLSSKTCSQKYFDVEINDCQSKNLVVCDAHPTTGVCLNGSKPITGFQSDGATCRGYFYCADKGIVEDLSPMWNQCPEGYFYDNTNKKCTTPKSVVCTYNRCEGRGNILVTSSRNDCHNYIRCVDGFEEEEITCAWDYFFDESIQGCTPNIIYDGCCDGQK